MKGIRKKLLSYKVFDRIIACSSIFLILFFAVTIISYYILPNGFLRSKSNITNFDMSANIFVGSIQIFLWNLLSVLAIIFASLFDKQKDDNEPDYSLGYSVFFILIMLNAVILGTWSFTSGSINPPSLFNRLIGTFDLVHRGGLWEMIGQMCVTCSLAHISVINIAHKKAGKVKDIKISASEKVAFFAGIIFIYIGALIETISIKLL